MKKLLVISLVAVLAVTVACAKPPKGGGPAKMSPPTAKAGPGGHMQGRGHFRDDLYKKLKLTAPQKKKIDAIDAKYKKQFESMRGQKPDPKGFEKFRGLMDKRNKEIMAVLDKNQKKTYEAEMKKWRTMRRPGPGGPGGMGRPGGPGAPMKSGVPKKPAK